MKKKIKVLFPDIDREISIELDDSRSPKTVQAILENLPIQVTITRWGDELYTEKTKIIAEEENAKREVNFLDVAYWPEGNALCLFYGPTPISKDGQILAYSPVNIVGRIIPHDDEKDDLLEKTKENTRLIFK
ncbi:MAG TPA: cyclophilin-like fold protein [Nitrososphaeraceae archaeon]|nr:cyclophilin-like fold protein [Nitrososphaeraceae archaeon]